MPNLSRKLTPYQRIMRAAAQGCGLRLTADEVEELAGDDAIEAVARGDDERMSNSEVAQAWRALESARRGSVEYFEAHQRLRDLGELA